MKSIAIVMVLLIMPVMALGYSSGPPDGKTGAPDEGTCVDCHTSFPLNSGDGSLSISGPTEYLAGETYIIEVQISDPDQSRWGFEFSPLEYGSIIISDPINTQMSSSGGRTYIKHTTAGTYQGTPDGPVSWSFQWTAPATPPDSVIFYAAGNGANGNGNNQGDYIYTTSFTSKLQVTGVNENGDFVPSEAALHNYPNPFNAATKIVYNVPSNSFVNLSIYNLRGQKVETLVSGNQEAGNKSVAWDASGYPSGIYFYRLTAGEKTETRFMSLLK
ncbi:MAG: hypothetical protein CO189_03830 [candidate division Zixibacteria bacterium CG_4_9_14_3_um_filter_46_8]|nr:MAG: hypothetical protein CO189_03830 [candidate division Zixibacteria bacterium CG_4_9_14_3_um_filter_46_8]